MCRNIGVYWGCLVFGRIEIEWVFVKNRIVENVVEIFDKNNLFHVFHTGWSTGLGLRKASKR